MSGIKVVKAVSSRSIRDKHMPASHVSSRFQPRQQFTEPFEHQYILTCDYTDLQLVENTMKSRKKKNQLNITGYLQVSFEL